MLGEKQRTNSTAKEVRGTSSREVARTLYETREALRQYETSALADVARTLSSSATTFLGRAALSLVTAERLFVEKGCRRLTVRYERRADIHQAFLDLACALICCNYLSNRN